MSFAWKGFHSFGGGFSPSFGPSLTGGITPIGSWDASTSTLAQLAALVSHSRTSLATMFDSTGKLTYAPNNLLTQSNNFSDASWTKTNVTVASGVADPFGSTNAWTITATANNGYVEQAFSLTGAPSYNGLNTVWLRRRTGSGAVNTYGPAALVGVPVALTGAWQQFQVATAGNADGHFYSYPVYITTNGDAIDIYAPTMSLVTYETLASQRPADQVITTAAAYYGPRVDYTYNGSSWVPAGLLVEGSATNYNYPSEGTQASWVNSTVGTTPLGLFGGINLYTVTQTLANTQTYMACAWTPVVAASVMTASVALVAGSQSTASFGIYGSTSNWGANGNSSAVVLSGSGAVVQNIGGLFNVTGLTSTPTVIAVTRSGDFASSETAGAIIYQSVGAAGSAGATIKYGRMQLEAGSFATSYIPTGASSVTRAADVVQFAGAALAALQGSAGSAIVEADNYVGQSALLIGNNSFNALYYNGFMATYGGTTLSTANAIPTNAFFRGAVSWGPSARSIVMNGGTVAKDTGAFGTYTTAYLGSNNGASNMDGHVKSFAIYNQRLPDATLQARSVVGASY